MRFLQMISTPPMRTDQIVRYSGVRQTDPENLAMHLVDLQMIGYAVSKQMNKLGEDIDIGLFLEKALIHDMDEVLTGDMPRSTKYYNPTLLQEMRNVADDAMRQVSETFFNDEDTFTVWSESKAGKEGVLVKVLDMLCVASKAMKEVELLNNNYFLKVVFEVRQHLLDVVYYLDENSPYNAKSTAYLKQLVLEAHDEVERLWHERRLIAERYGILQNIFQSKGVETK